MAVIDARTANQRLDDLEHDNNLLRSQNAEIQAEYRRLDEHLRSYEQKMDRTLKAVNDFIARFAVVN